MKARGLINWCVMLLWFVATYHCAFEQLISEHGNQLVSQSTTSSDSSSPSECPSHTPGDPSSHSEGESCGVALQTSSSNEFREATQVALIPVVDAFLAAFNNSLGYSYSFHSNSSASFETADSMALSQRAHSLSIAPNAPPVTLA